MKSFTGFSKVKRLFLIANRCQNRKNSKADIKRLFVQLDKFDLELDINAVVNTSNSIIIFWKYNNHGIGFA